jgi:hypothetical protein
VAKGRTPGVRGAVTGACGCCRVNTNCRVRCAVRKRTVATSAGVCTKGYHQLDALSNYLLATRLERNHRCGGAGVNRQRQNVHA